MGLPEDAAPFEVLARSGGRRVGDLLEVVEVPRRDHDGRVALPFLVHGVRHQSTEAREAIDRLEEGDPLTLVAEDQNSVDRQAVAVIDGRPPVRLGYVPAPLAGVARQLIANPAHRLTVLRRNASSAGFHHRLLVELVGRLDSEPFDGAKWQTV